ncbi:MAG TPA: DNA gyrase subunit A [Bacilli bacterium]|nr:DNA gyrase subunit A [Bacilli bacterium]
MNEKENIELELNHDSHDKVKDHNIITEMKTSFLNYAMSVIVSRALPDVRDGLKPVHRRILYAMNDLGVHGDKPHKKSARIVGDVIGKYHPHGDSAVYDAMVRMAQDFSYRYPLVDGHGNFGSVDGDGAAAMRYTEARMSKLAMELLRDLNKNTVNFQDNYDGSESEPVVLPSRFPNLLVNGATGIAVGMATNIPPHNLTEVIDGVLALIENPEISIERLMEYIPAPDFPTGGILMGLSQVKKAYLTGSGSVTIRSKIDIVNISSQKEAIIITEIPYQVNKTKLIERIAELARNKVVDGITDLRDESNRKGTRIVIELRKDANSGVILNNLYKHTQLQITFGMNMLALDNGQPKVMNLKEMLVAYLNHQIEVVTRRTQYDLDRAQARAHIVQGLLIALANIDEIVQLLKASKTTEAALNGLMTNYILSEIQAKAILDMRLQRLTGLEIEKLEQEYQELLSLIAELQLILEHHDKKLQLIVNELSEIQQRFGDDRVSSLDMSEELTLEDEDLIPVEDVIVTITNRGYIKRLTVDTYRAQNRGGKGITGTKMSDDDFVSKILYTSSHDILLFFTNFGKVYRLKAFQVPVSSRTSKGLPIVNLLNFEKDEKLAAVLNLNNIEDNPGFIMFATRLGLVKKTEIVQFKNIRTTGIRAIILPEGDELFSVALTDGNKDIILGASNGKAIRFHEEDVRPMGRISAGVRGIKVEGSEYSVGMAVVDNDDDEVLVLTDKGYGKRTKVDAYRRQVRGGKGVKSLNMTDKNGELVCLNTVTGEDDLIVITDKGMVIRTHLDQISTMGRDTQGVRVISLYDGQSVATMAIVPRNEEEESEEIITVESRKSLDEIEKESSFSEETKSSIDDLLDDDKLVE